MSISASHALRSEILPLTTSSMTENPHLRCLKIACRAHKNSGASVLKKNASEASVLSRHVLYFEVFAVDTSLKVHDCPVDHMQRSVGEHIIDE